MKSGSTIISEYIYDVLGRRTQKKVGNDTVTYIYSNKNILEEVRNNEIRDFKKVYVNGLGTDNLIAYEQEEPDLSIAERNELNFCNDKVLGHTASFTKYGWNDIVNRCNTLSTNGSVIVENMYYFHKNHLGSVVGITDKLGNSVSEYDYDVFGKATLISGDDTGNTRLYTGREYDKEIGLYFLRARYYDPITGRFISKDPIGQIDDVNLYAYVGNNSVMYVDLMGTEKTALPAIYEKNYFLRGVILANKINESIENTVSDIHNNFDYDAMIKTGKSMKLIGYAGMAGGGTMCVVGTAATAGVGTIPSCGGGVLVAVEGALMTAAGYGMDALGQIGKNSQKKGGTSTTARQNKANHIFGKSQHNLDGLVDKYGSQEKALIELNRSARNQIKTNQGIFEEIINVGGTKVTVRGSVINGEIKIGTAYRP